MTGFYLKQVLDKYSALVAEKKAKKIDYTVWQKLAKAAKEDTIVDVNVRGNRVTVQLSEGDYVVIENSMLAELFSEPNADDKSMKSDFTTFSDVFATIGELSSTLNSSLIGQYATTAMNSYYNNRLTTADPIPYNIGSTSTAPIDSLNLTIRDDDAKLYELKNGEYISIGKEKENMNMLKNFSFGPVDNDNVKMSIYGLCVKNKAGTYVAYDTKSGDMMDVDILNFNGKNFLYQVPVALNQVTEGTIIIHNRVPMFVVNVPQDRKSLDVIDPYAGECKEILPTRSPFGFDFVTRIVSLFDQFAGVNNADASNPFGNMLPLLMLSDSSKDEKDILPLMMAMGGNIDPMMVMVMMNGDNKDMLLPMMFMMNQKKDNGCKCGGQCQH